MCAIKNGDEIRCDFPSQLCPLVIYLLEKMSRFGSIRALVVPLPVVNRALYPARTSLRALFRIAEVFELRLCPLPLPRGADLAAGVLCLYSRSRVTVANSHASLALTNHRIRPLRSQKHQAQMGIPVVPRSGLPSLDPPPCRWKLELGL